MKSRTLISFCQRPVRNPCQGEAAPLAVLSLRTVDGHTHSLRRPHGAGLDQSQQPPVCRAIISSSLVGITQADTRLPAREIRGPLARVGVGIELDAEPGAGLADPRADLGRVLADAGGEHEAVDAAQRRGERADLLGRAIDEVVHRQPCARARARRADRACRC